MGTNADQSTNSVTNADADGTVASDTTSPEQGTNTDTPVSPPENGKTSDSFPAEYVKTLRNQLANERTSRKADQDILARIAKAIGAEGSAPDPDKLQKTLDERDSEIRKLKIQSALSDVFSDQKAKPSLTRAVLRDEGVLDDLDPSGSDFADKLNAAVKAALAAHPELRTESLIPGRGGGDSHKGGGNQQRQLSDQDLEKMSDDEIVEAESKGLLNKLLGRV